MKILETLAENPGSTAQELGTTVPVMAELERAGKVIRVGTRKMGKRGRPPVEWAVAGSDYEAVPAKGIEEAKAKVDEYRAWVQAIAEHDARRRAGHDTGREPVMPEVPTTNDYLLAGYVKDDELVAA